MSAGTFHQNGVSQRVTMSSESNDFKVSIFYRNFWPVVEEVNFTWSNLATPTLLLAYTVFM